MAVAARFSSNSNKTLLGRSLQSVLFLYLAQDIFSKNSDNSNSKDRDSLTDVFTTSQTLTPQFMATCKAHLQKHGFQEPLLRARGQRLRSQICNLHLVPLNQRETNSPFQNSELLVSLIMSRHCAAPLPSLTPATTLRGRYCYFLAKNGNIQETSYITQTTTVLLK